MYPVALSGSSGAQKGPLNFILQVLEPHVMFSFLQFMIASAICQNVFTDPFDTAPKNIDHSAFPCS
jgi:hypothetical protein